MAVQADIHPHPWQDDYFGEDVSGEDCIQQDLAGQTEQKAMTGSAGVLGRLKSLDRRKAQVKSAVRRCQVVLISSSLGAYVSSFVLGVSAGSCGRWTWVLVRWAIERRQYVISYGHTCLCMCKKVSDQKNVFKFLPSTCCIHSDTHLFCHTNKLKITLRVRKLNYDIIYINWPCEITLFFN